MFKYIIPTTLTAIAIGLFVIFTNPIYKDVQGLRAQVASYDQALTNAEQLRAVREQLLLKYNGFSKENIAKVQKMIPDNVDNIRLILEIQGMASAYGMQIKNVKYDAKVAAGVDIVPQNAAASADQNKIYGIFDMEFSTEGTYDNFIKFVGDMEHSLRIVDINSVTFSSSDSMATTPLNTVYKYDLKFKTYWLKK
jgi:Tfp pilus assembly protein PilO